MNCDQSQALLFDVACDAADASAASDVRAHAATCAACGPALRKIEQGLSLARALPLAEPSAAVSEKILRAARDHQLATAALATSAATRSVEPTHSFADTVRVFLGQFAMGRQFAMLTVMVLVTAVGLWFVPRARQHEIAGGNVVNPDPDGEAGPSNGIVPAAPLDLDLRQGRIRPRDEAIVERAAREPAPTAEPELGSADDSIEAEKSAEEAAPVVAQAPLGGSEEIAAMDQAAERQELAMEAPGMGPAADEQEQPVEAKTRGRAATSSVESARSDQPYALAEGDSVAATAPTSAPMARRAPDPYPASARPQATTAFAPPPAPAPAPRATAASGAGAAVSNEAPATEAREADTARSAAKEQSAVASGLASFRSAQYADAITALERARAESGDQISTAARLALARSYQRTSRCGNAVTHYEAVLRSAPRNVEVMHEAAACYRQLGRAPDANRWMARANAIAASNDKKAAAAPAAEQQ